MIRLYLAHPFNARAWVRDWEFLLESKTHQYSDPIELINPFYDVPERADIIAIDRGDINRYDQSNDIIIRRDLKLIESCDGMLAIAAPGNSIGTYMEIFYAAHILHRPVFLYLSREFTNEHHNEMARHPWLAFLCTKIVTNKSTIEEILSSLYIKDGRLLQRIGIHG